jgi:hypothetical protein
MKPILSAASKEKHRIISIDAKRSTYKIKLLCKIRS